ncbi:MAG: hypothetical protein R3C39_04070 [Dehalococcoidia bacterium]
MQPRTLSAAAFLLLTLLLATACADEDLEASRIDGLEPLAPFRVDELTSDLPDAYVLHLREVQFTRGGTRNGLVGSPEAGQRLEFEFDTPEHAVFDWWIRVEPDGGRHFLSLLRDASGAHLVRTQVEDAHLTQIHVPSGTTVEVESANSPDAAEMLASLEDTLPTERDRLLAGVEDGTFWTRPSEADDRILIGEPSDGCGRNNERLPDTSRVQEVWADDSTPTGLRMCVAGPADAETLLERTETGIEILPLDRWPEIEEFVLGDIPEPDR